MKQAARDDEQAIATNRKALHDYEVLERVEAGLVLRGTEVKSIREGGFNFRDGWVEPRNGEMFLSGVRIGPYSHGNLMNHSEDRARKLLLHRHQIDKLGGRVAERGFTLVPLRAYFKGGKVKIEIGLARGKKSHDKRETLKRKDIDRDTRQEMNRRR